MTRLAFAFVFVLLFSAACKNVVRDRKQVDPDSIFLDYKIRGEEKDSTVTVYIQYKMGGPNGPTLVLDDPARVQLDDEIIPTNSAKLSGAYYEIQEPSDLFAGTHTISFTDFNKKEYKEEFVYKPFKLRTPIPSIIKRGDLAFDFEGLGPEDYIRVIATDTSFISRDINEIDTVMNNRLIISAGRLKNLVNGPIILLLSKETEKPVKNSTRAGGRIVVSYGLQREFELRDSRPPPDVPR
jgi:hypothetical protein